MSLRAKWPTVIQPPFIFHYILHNSIQLDNKVVNIYEYMVQVTGKKARASERTDCWKKQKLNVNILCCASIFWPLHTYLRPFFDNSLSLSPSVSHPVGSLVRNNQFHKILLLGLGTNLFLLFTSKLSSDSVQCVCDVRVGVCVAQ